MVKKINKDALAIKSLIEKGMKQADIARLLGLKRKKVSYWAHTDPMKPKKRRKQFSQFYVDKIINLAKNKTTSAMSSRRIANIINSILIIKEIKSNGKQMKISFKTVNNYLKEFYGRPKKVRKVFFFF